MLSHYTRNELKRDLRHLLWMTLYQVFFMHKAVYHVVDEAVEYVKASRGQGMANFVNAVLRRSIREREALSFPADPVLRLSIQYSFPRWIVERWLTRYGFGETSVLLDLLNHDPEFGLRVDTGKITKQAAKEKLSSLGVNVQEGRYLEGALRVDRIGPILADDILSTDLVHVQEETSQMAVLALSPAPGELVLDACAGQGTKSSQIRQICPEARLIAMDLDKKKLHSIRGTACLVQADATKNPFKKGLFDSILLDAPCSSLGIIRKHPEIKWRRTGKDVARHGTVQKEMIRAMSDSLRKGGRLVYSVCSFEPEETVDVVEDLAREEHLVLEKALPFADDAPWFLSLPHVTGLDGFFVAVFRKS